DVKGLQVTVVNADYLSPAFQCTLQLFVVVNFTQHIQIHGSGAIQERPESLVIQCGQNQQDCVSMMGPGFQNLEFIDNEILAQAGQVRGSRSFHQVWEGALKILFVGQNGQGGGATVG